LINLANDLAMLSKIENQKVKFSAKKINLKRVVSDTVEFFKIKAKEKGIKIFIKGRNRIFVYGDPDLIEQMLVNLIDNAIKYTEKGKIEIVLSREDNYAIIQVSDTGIGIPEADIPHIFERFYVVDKSRSKRICGTGLGLSIVKHIVLLHKGSISVESKENKGTTFTIKIPINQNS
jgi:two-component system phosphate regulon sensor histidine kinase PhoR